jgi:hypothetical protein
MSPPRKKYLISKNLTKLFNESYVGYIKDICLELNIQPMSSAHHFLHTLSAEWKSLLQGIRIQEDNYIEIALGIQTFIFELSIAHMQYREYVKKTLDIIEIEGTNVDEYVNTLCGEEDEDESDDLSALLLDSFIMKIERLVFSLYDYIFGYGSHKSLITYIFDGTQSLMPFPTDENNLFVKEDSPEKRLFTAKEYKLKDKEYKKKYSSIVVYREIVKDKEAPFLLFFMGKRKLTSVLTRSERSSLYYVNAPDLVEEDAIDYCVVHFIEEALSADIFMPRPVGLDKL